MLKRSPSTLELYLRHSLCLQFLAQGHIFKVLDALSLNIRYHFQTVSPMLHPCSLRRSPMQSSARLSGPLPSAQVLSFKGIRCLISTSPTQSAGDCTVVSGGQGTRAWPAIYQSENLQISIKDLAASAAVQHAVTALSYGDTGHGRTLCRIPPVPFLTGGSAPNAPKIIHVLRVKMLDDDHRCAINCRRNVYSR